MLKDLEKKIFFQRGARKLYNVKHGISLIELEKLGKKNILEVACGKGLLSLYLSDFAHSVTGIDVSESEINEANKNKNNLNIQNCEFLATDIIQSHLPLDEYDLIVAQAALHHIIYDFRIGDKLWELLKPGGKLIFITEPLSYNWFNEFIRLFRHLHNHQFGEFQLWFEHIEQFGRKFSKINYYYFDIFSQYFKILEFIFPQKLYLKIAHKLWQLDDFILKRFPKIKKYSPNINIEMIK